MFVKIQHNARLVKRFSPVVCLALAMSGTFGGGTLAQYNTATTPRPTPTKLPAPQPAPKGLISKAATARTVNSHLHGVAADTTSAKVASKTSGSPWANRWNYSAWTAQNLGTGVIEGYVRDNSNRPVPKIRLALRGPKGGVFRNIAMRHITYTDSNGHFLMTNVKARAYRIFVRTMDQKKKTHVQTNLDVGGHLQLVIMFNV